MKRPSIISAAAFFLLLFAAAPVSEALAAGQFLRFLYPSFGGTWAAPWIAKEAGYFAAEGLDVELVRVGGSTRIVAAMVGGSAPMIHAGASAALAATAAGSDTILIAAISNVSSFHVMARPEIRQPSDLRGKTAGISAFGSSSDFVVRLALKKYGLEPGRDVAIIPMGGQPEGFAALQAGSVHLLGMTFPLYLSAAKLGFKELIKVSDLGFEDVTGGVITTRSFMAQQRDTALRFMKAFIRGVHRYKTDKEFSKRVIAKYMRVSDADAIEDSYQFFARLVPAKPYPPLDGIKEALLELGEKDPKARGARPEDFTDMGLVRELDESGFIDALYKGKR